MTNITVDLISISPFAFSVIKVGEQARVELKRKKMNEYRDKIGPASDCYLVFKGQTKIGMIPKIYMEKNINLLSKRVCWIKIVDPQNLCIAISFDKN
jgi:hypothetical protein